METTSQDGDGPDQQQVGFAEPDADTVPATDAEVHEANALALKRGADDPQASVSWFACCL